MIVVNVVMLCNTTFGSTVVYMPGAPDMAEGFALCDAAVVAAAGGVRPYIFLLCR